MPPYTPVVSKAQSRALFAKAERGEGISMEDARGKTAAANFSSLPDRVGHGTIKLKGVKRGKSGRARLRPR